MDWMISKKNSRTFSTCPKCGARALKPHKMHAFYCPECDFVFYLNVAAAVTGLITDSNGRLLVAVRANEPEKGKYDLPGGFIDPGESAEQAIFREIYEELNLEVVGVNYFCSYPNQYLYKGVYYATEDIAFICTINDFSPVKPRDDVAQIVWLSEKQIQFDQFGFLSIQVIVERFLENQSE